MPRPFLPVGTNTPAWPPDGTRLVYVDKANRDDPIYLADRYGADARPMARRRGAPSAHYGHPS